jgi:hypothetical protein
MASGCIVGDCYLCKMPVFEDEARWNDKINKFKHSYCKMNKELQFENERLQKELDEFRRWFGASLCE